MRGLTRAASVAALLAAVPAAAPPRGPSRPPPRRPPPRRRAPSSSAMRAAPAWRTSAPAPCRAPSSSCTRCTAGDAGGEATLALGRVKKKLAAGEVRAGLLLADPGPGRAPHRAFHRRRAAPRSAYAVAAVRQVHLRGDARPATARCAARSWWTARRASSSRSSSSRCGAPARLVRSTSKRRAGGQRADRGGGPPTEEAPLAHPEALPRRPRRRARLGRPLCPLDGDRSSPGRPRPGPGS